MANYIEVGSNPANVTWNVVRGDTATLLVQFFENDEVTPIDTDNWTFAASAYNPRTNTRYTLGTDEGSNAVTISADPATTEEWGTGISSTVAELTYDLEVTLQDGVVWTPVIGTIKVTGDVTGATL
jgi:hypothetical protein